MGFTVFENYNGTRAYLADTIDSFEVVELDDVKYFFRSGSRELKDKMGAEAYRIVRELSDSATAVAVPISRDKDLLKRIEAQYYSTPLEELELEVALQAIEMGGEGRSPNIDY